MVKRIFLFMSILLFASCDKTLYDLTMVKTPYTGNELRIDGYYYSNYYKDVNVIGIAVFYRDGVCIHMFAGPPGQDTLNFIENDILLNNSLMSKVRSKPTGIGVFQVNMESIVFETWEVLSPFRHSGKILNDTTFLLTERINVRPNYLFSPNLTYRFRQFSSKPDSTNTFIK